MGAEGLSYYIPTEIKQKRKPARKLAPRRTREAPVLKYEGDLNPVQSADSKIELQIGGKRLESGKNFPAFLANGDYVFIELENGDIYYDKRVPNPRIVAGPFMISHRSLMRKAVEDGADFELAGDSAAPIYKIELRLMGEFTLWNNEFTAISNRAGSVPKSTEEHIAAMKKRFARAGRVISNRAKVVDVADELAQAKARGRSDVGIDLGHLDSIKLAKIERELSLSAEYGKALAEIELLFYELYQNPKLRAKTGRIGFLDLKESWLTLGFDSRREHSEFMLTLSMIQNDGSSGGIYLREAGFGMDEYKYSTANFLVDLRRVNSILSGGQFENQAEVPELFPTHLEEKSFRTFAASIRENPDQQAQLLAVRKAENILSELSPEAQQLLVTSLQKVWSPNAPNRSTLVVAALSLHQNPEDAIASLRTHGVYFFEIEEVALLIPEHLEKIQEDIAKLKLAQKETPKIVLDASPVEISAPQFETIPAMNPIYIANGDKEVKARLDAPTRDPGGRLRKLAREILPLLHQRFAVEQGRDFERTFIDIDRLRLFLLGNVPGNKTTTLQLRVFCDFVAAASKDGYAKSVQDKLLDPYETFPMPGKIMQVYWIDTFEVIEATIKANP
jgi:hypothetical protein